MIYLLVKSLHVCAIIFWVGGMLVQLLLLRAARSLSGPPLPLELARLRLLRQWDRGITAPAMLLAWASGLFIATYGGWFGSVWLFMKLALVLALSAVHGWLAGRLRRCLAASARAQPASGALLLPGMLALTAAIVFLVVAKPA